MEFYEKRDTCRRVFFLTPKKIKPSVFHLYTRKETLSVSQESARPQPPQTWKDRSSKVFRRLFRVEPFGKRIMVPYMPILSEQLIQAVETIATVVQENPCPFHLASNLDIIYKTTHFSGIQNARVMVIVSVEISKESLRSASVCTWVNCEAVRMKHGL